MSRRVFFSSLSAEHGDIENVVIVHPAEVTRVLLECSVILKIWVDYADPITIDLDDECITDDDEHQQLDRRFRAVAQKMIVDLLTLTGDDSKWIYCPWWAKDTSRRTMGGTHCTGWDNVQGATDDSVPGHRR